MRVFLSSTYSDLIEYRRVAVDTLERLGLQVGRMEVFGARPDEPTVACLDEIDDADFFVGIYAHRYGYIPESASMSITEAEFQHALQAGKFVFCFVVDDKHPWPLSMIEDEEPGKTRLREFKQQIEHARVRDSFTTPDDLGLKIATAVGRHIATMIEKSPDEPKPSSGLPSLASVAGVAVAQTLAMVFVDLMRLLYVTSSKAARAANERRYTEFIAIGERHLDDFRASLAQFASALDSTSHQRSVILQRRLSWVLDRLRVGLVAPEQARKYWPTMRQIADGVEEFCLGVAPEHYSREREKVRATFDEVQGVQVAVPAQSLDETWRLRLAIQSRVLDESRKAGDTTLFTIADDMDQRLGISYFLIDRMLLASI